MTSSTVDQQGDVAEQNSDERRSPREVLSAFEDQMKQKVKRFDLRVLGNKRKLEKIHGHLNMYLDGCQKSFERKLDEFDARVDELAAKIEAYEKKLSAQPEVRVRESKDE